MGIEDKINAMVEARLESLIAAALDRALGGSAGALEPPDPDVLVGEWVIVRSQMSGVWLGRMESYGAAPGGPSSVVLSEARRAWRWQGAGSCSGLASQGPSGGRIAAPLRVRIAETVEVVGPVSAEALARWAAVPVWVI